MVCGFVSDYLVPSFLGGFATAKILLFYEMQMVFEQIISTNPNFKVFPYLCTPNRAADLFL